MLYTHSSGIIYYSVESTTRSRISVSQYMFNKQTGIAEYNNENITAGHGGSSL